MSDAIFVATCKFQPKPSSCIGRIGSGQILFERIGSDRKRGGDRRSVPCPALPPLVSFRLRRLCRFLGRSGRQGGREDGWGIGGRAAEALLTLPCADTRLPRSPGRWCGHGPPQVGSGPIYDWGWGAWTQSHTNPLFSVI